MAATDRLVVTDLLELLARPALLCGPDGRVVAASPDLGVTPGRRNAVLALPPEPRCWTPTRLGNRGVSAWTVPVGGLHLVLIDLADDRTPAPITLLVFTPQPDAAEPWVAVEPLPSPAMGPAARRLVAPELLDAALSGTVTPDLLRWLPASGDLRLVPFAGVVVGLLDTARMAPDGPRARILDALDEAVTVLEPVHDHTGRVVDARVLFVNRAVSGFAHHEPVASGALVSEAFTETRTTIAALERIRLGEPRVDLDVDNDDASRWPALRPGYVAASFIPAGDGTVLEVLRDRTDERRERRALERTLHERSALFDTLAEGIAVSEPVFGADGGIDGLRFLWTNSAAEGLTGRTGGETVLETDPAAVVPILLAARAAWATGRAGTVVDNPGHRTFPHLRSERLEVNITRLGDLIVASFLDRTAQVLSEQRFTSVVDALDEGITLLVPVLEGDELVALDVVYENPTQTAITGHRALPHRLDAGDRYRPVFDAAIEAWSTGRSGVFRIDNLLGQHPGIAPVVAEVRLRRIGALLVAVLQDRTELATSEVERLRVEGMLASSLNQLPDQTSVCEPIFDDDGVLVDARVLFNNEASARDGAILGRRTSEAFYDPVQFLAAARDTWATNRTIRYTFTHLDGDDRIAFESAVARCGEVILATLTDRTAEMRTRQALDDSNRRYRLTTETLPLGVAVLRVPGDPAESEPEVIYANPMLERAIGRDVVGLAPADVFPLWDQGRDLVRRAWLDEGRVARLDVDNLDQAITDALPSASLRLEARRSDDQVVVVLVDRTSEALGARALAMAHDRLARVFESLDEAVLVVDEQLDVIVANEAANTLLGIDGPITAERLVCIEAIDTTGRVLDYEDGPVGRTLTTGRPTDGEVLQLHDTTTGRRIWMRLNTRPLPLGNGRSGVLLTGTDITEGLAAEERFHATVDALEEAVVLYEPLLDEAGMLVDARMVYMNPAARGFRRADLPPGYLVTERFHRPDVALAAMRNVWETGRVGHYSVDNTGPDHDADLLTRHFDVTTYRAGSLLIGVSVDRTPAVQAAQALASAEHRFATTIEAIDEELAFFTPVLDGAGELTDLRIMYGNRSWHAQRDNALPSSSHLLVSEYYVDADDFLDAARAAWTTRERQVYVLTNPGRVRYPVLKSEHIEFSVLRVGDELVSVGLDRSAEQATLGRFRELAAHDHETGLLSQAGLSSRLTELLAAGGTVGLVVIEVGQLEQVQRGYGFRAAEGAVREIASRLGSTMQTAAVARVGSSTFVVALSGVRRTADVTSAANELVAVVQRPVEVDGLRLRLDASSGAVMSPLHGTDADTLVRRAKSAAWTALRSRLRCTVWSSQLEQQAPPQEVALLSDIDRGLANGEFFLDYQPKLRLSDHSLAGAEALVRWRHPERGVVSPGSFIPLVEDSTLARPFTEHVITMAVDAWKREPSLAGLRVAVNLPAVLVNDPALVESIADALVQAGAPATLLELEITERGLVAGDAVVRSNLAELRNLGIHLAIDDFGTGAASLSYLRWLPVESVKIDRTFVSNLEHDAVNRSVVEACVTVARALDLGVVAEGVETEVEAQVVAELGCTFAQGYLFGRPAPLERLLPMAGPRR